MKFYGLSIPKLALYSVLYPFFPFSLMLIVTFIACVGTDSSEWLVFVFEILFVALLVGGYVYYFRRAFGRYKITSKGISNPYLTIDWASISTCETYSVDVNLFSRYHKTNLTTVCVFPTQSVRSFTELDPRECVYFEVNRKNIGLIARYCPHPSEDVKELLHRYSDLLHSK